jgi:hypothetical protein
MAGKEKLHYLNPVPIARVGRRWIDKFSVRKSAAILNLKEALEKGKIQEETDE